MMTKAQARALTDRIRVMVENLIPLVMEAYRGRADKALGYDSWADYCRVELHGLSIPVGMRREAASALHSVGMSGRAIGAALGVDDKTVRNDLAGETSGAENSAPENVTGLDGKQYAACRPQSRTKVEVKRSPLHFAEQASAMIAVIDDQHYGPSDLTAEQLRVFGNLRDALEEFAVVFHAEEMASIQESEQRCP